MRIIYKKNEHIKSVLAIGLSALVSTLVLLGCANEPISPTQIITIDEQHKNFPLQGAHKQVTCISCHINEKFVDMDNSCATCHKTDFQASKVAIHQNLTSSFDCALCHQNSSWTDSTFNHSGIGFDLEGAHKTTDCVACHTIDQVGTPQIFAGLPAECVSCHLDDYNAAKEPSHLALSYPTNCLECHSQETWVPSVFDHSTFDFALNGAHQGVACKDCHINGIYEGTPTNCLDCHKDDFDRVDEPNHVELGFPTNCLECHTEVAWEPAAFDHSTFDFALNGAHQIVSCSACHASGVYDGLPTDCWSCHQDNFQSATEPVHLEPSFTQDCLACHTEALWAPSFFAHNNVGFPLLGAHQNSSCSSCHAGGVYAETPTDCASCHADDEPKNHFGPDCAACHTPRAWTPSTFNHDRYFPINRGDHRAYRNDCSACHLNPMSFSTFSCINCHDGEHRKRDMDDEHDDVRRYTYQSAACYACHPDGDE